MTFDLNLLRILVALNTHRSVTRAADSLNMSQPGFSTALMRLRQQVGDALFVRVGNAMQPTPRALHMISAAERTLRTVEEDILGRPRFDAATAQTDYRVAIADVGEQAFLPSLLRALQAQAPGITVRTAMLPSGALEHALGQGDVDLAVGYFPELRNDALVRQRLFTHTFACLVPAHVHVQDGVLSLEDFQTLPHGVAEAPIRAQAVFEDILARRQLRRRITIRTQNFLVLPYLVAELDIIAVVPLSLALAVRDWPGIQVAAPPFPAPCFDIAQHWHRRFHDDTRHRWLRGQFTALFGHGDPWHAYGVTLYGKHWAAGTARPPRFTDQRGMSTVSMTLMTPLDWYTS